MRTDVGIAVGATILHHPDGAYRANCKIICFCSLRWQFLHTYYYFYYIKCLFVRANEHFFCFPFAVSVCQYKLPVVRGTLGDWQKANMQIVLQCENFLTPQHLTQNHFLPTPKHLLLTCHINGAITRVLFCAHITVSFFLDTYS